MKNGSVILKGWISALLIIAICSLFIACENPMVKEILGDNKKKTDKKAIASASITVVPPVKNQAPDVAA